MLKGSHGGGACTVMAGTHEQSCHSTASIFSRGAILIFRPVNIKNQGSGLLN
jgi:hypothetical protein